MHRSVFSQVGGLFTLPTSLGGDIYNLSGN